MKAPAIAAASCSISLVDSSVTSCMSPVQVFPVPAFSAVGFMECRRVGARLQQLGIDLFSEFPLCLLNLVGGAGSSYLIDAYMYVEWHTHMHTPAHTHPLRYRIKVIFLYFI